MPHVSGFALPTNFVTDPTITLREIMNNVVSSVRWQFTATSDPLQNVKPQIYSKPLAILE